MKKGLKVTKVEIIEMMRHIPDDQEVDFVLWDNHDNWEVDLVSVNGCAPEGVFEFELRLDEKFGIVTLPDEDEILEDMFLEMEDQQSYIGDMCFEGMTLADIVGDDVSEEVGYFIECALKANKSFKSAHLFRVINGAYPEIDGDKVVPTQGER
jgi:hypothetical protein